MRIGCTCLLVQFCLAGPVVAVAPVRPRERDWRGLGFPIGSLVSSR